MMFRKRETGVNDDNDGRGQGRGEGRGPATIARGSKGAAAPAGRARFPRTNGCRRGSLRAKTMTGERARRRNGATAQMSSRIPRTCAPHAPAGRARFPRAKGCRQGSLRAKTMTGERARGRNGATARQRDGATARRAVGRCERETVSSYRPRVEPHKIGDGLCGKLGLGGGTGKEQGQRPDGAAREAVAEIDKM